MPKSVRTTISLPTDQYKELVKIAKDQRVSTAWIFREAVRSYLASRYPLFHQNTADDIRDRVSTGLAERNKE